MVKYFCYEYYLVKEHILKNDSQQKRQKSSHNTLGCKIRIWINKSLNIAKIDCIGNFLYHVQKLKDINL